jgi:hypothetical protein
MSAPQPELKTAFSNVQSLPNQVKAWPSTAASCLQHWQLSLEPLHIHCRTLGMKHTHTAATGIKR